MKWSLRKRTWEFVEVARSGDRLSAIFDYFILILIAANVAAVMLGTVESFEKRFSEPLFAFEVFSVLVFSIEYAARLWSCVSDPRFATAVTGRLTFALRPLVVLDLLAIVPFFLPVLGLDLRSLRALRLLRIVRVAKIGRYYSSMRLIGHVLREKQEELVLTSGMMGLLLVLSSSLLYYCENPAQPESFSSIPATMWWAVATLTTVGYGDMSPVTAIGKICAGVIAVLGIGMFALPTGILGAGFVEAIQNRKDSPVCPHCGKKI
jgi:voltage-gated potassium channel